MPPRPPAPVPTIARQASRPVALADFHKPTTARRFNLAAGNLDAKITQKHVAFDAAQLEH
jgi:hypothetical protein